MFAPGAGAWVAEVSHAGGSVPMWLTPTNTVDTQADNALYVLPRFVAKQLNAQ